MLGIHTGTDKPTLESLNDHVRDEISSKWREVGEGLLKKECVDKLDEIEKNHPGDMEGCCTEMFKYWLEVDSEANWNKLTDALKQIGQSTLAKKVEEDVIIQGMLNVIYSYVAT